MQRQHPVWKKTAMHYKVKKKKTTKKPVETIPMGCAAQGQIKEIWSKLLSVLIFLKCLTPWWIKHPWLGVQPSCHEVGVVSLSHSENNLTGKKIDKARVSFLNLLPWFPRNLMRFCFRFHTQTPFRLLASRLWFLSLLFTAIPSTYNSAWHIWETPKSLLGVWVAWEEVICWLLHAYLSVHFILFHLPPAGQLHFLLALSHSLWRSLSHPRVKIETLSSGPLANILSVLSHFPFAPQTSPIALVSPTLLKGPSARSCTATANYCLLFSHYLGFCTRATFSQKFPLLGRKHCTSPMFLLIQIIVLFYSRPQGLLLSAF